MRSLRRFYWAFAEDVPAPGGGHNEKRGDSGKKRRQSPTGIRRFATRRGLHRRALCVQLVLSLTSSDTRSCRGRLLQALTIDSTLSVDSGCYRRYRLQKFRRSLKTAGWVFLQQNLQENNDRLWDIFESLDR